MAIVKWGFDLQIINRFEADGCVNQTGWWTSQMGLLITQACKGGWEKLCSLITGNKKLCLIAYVAKSSKLFINVKATRITQQKVMGRTKEAAAYSRDQHNPKVWKETGSAGVEAHRDWRVGALWGGEGGTPPFAPPSELQHAADGAEWLMLTDTAQIALWIPQSILNCWYCYWIQGWSWPVPKQQAFTHLLGV